MLFHLNHITAKRNPIVENPKIKQLSILFVVTKLKLYLCVLCFVFVFTSKLNFIKMADTENVAENPDNFAEEIIETGVIRKTVTRSYKIQEVSIVVVDVFIYQHHCRRHHHLRRYHNSSKSDDYIQSV